MKPSGDKDIDPSYEYFIMPSSVIVENLSERTIELSSKSSKLLEEPVSIPMVVPVFDLTSKIGQRIIYKVPYTNSKRD